MSVAEDLRDEPLVRCHQRVDPDAPDVVAVSHRDGCDAVFLRPLDGEIHRGLRNDLSPREVPVNHGRRRRLPNEARRRLWVNGPVRNVLAVLKEPEGAVGVVAGQIGTHQMVRDDPRILVRTTNGTQNVESEREEDVRRNVEH